MLIMLMCVTELLYRVVQKTTPFYSLSHWYSMARDRLPLSSLTKLVKDFRSLYVWIEFQIFQRVGAYICANFYENWLTADKFIAIIKGVLFWGHSVL